jgi:pyrroloquinoline quinone biosynthesis protein D
MRSTVPMRSDRGAVDGVRATSRPGLAPHVRLRFDRSREQHVLLGPESVVVLNRTGADILGLCDGQRTVAAIVDELNRRYDRAVHDEVQHFLARLVARRWVEISDG